jgi:hypothetical protein
MRCPGTQWVIANHFAIEVAILRQGQPHLVMSIEDPAAELTLCFSPIPLVPSVLQEREVLRAAESVPPQTIPSKRETRAQS